MFRKAWALFRKTKPTIDHGRLQTAPTPQVPHGHNADDPSGGPAPTTQGFTTHVCADADGSLYFTWHLRPTAHSFGLTVPV